MTVDTLPPATPTNMTIAAEGTPLTGTADDGTTVTVRDANGNIIGTGSRRRLLLHCPLPAQLDAATLTLIATDPQAMPARQPPLTCRTLRSSCLRCR
ncbi:Ig-like domain-containing protein [Enterobacter hormaechei]